MRPVRRKDASARYALIALGVVAALFLATWASDSWLGPDAFDFSEPSGAESDRTESAPGKNAGGGEATPASSSADASLADAATTPGSLGEGPGEAPDDESEASDESLGRNQVEPIFVEPLDLVTGGPTASIIGIDPYAPRDLVAWRIVGGRSAIMSRGSSDADGTIHFPDVLVPRDGLEVIVTEAGLTPATPGASELRRLPLRDPAAPHAQMLEVGVEEVRVRIVPTETTGSVLLADFEGNVFATYDVPTEPEAAHRILDIALTLPETDTEIWMAHQLEDGRVSDWRVVPLERLDVDALSDP